MKDLSKGMMFPAAKNEEWATDELRELIGTLQPKIAGLRQGHFHHYAENISLRVFGGREEADYWVDDTAGIFTYVMEGAFEIQHRLLEKGEGLALWDVGNIGIEALSNNAVILIIGLLKN